MDRILFFSLIFLFSVLIFERILLFELNLIDVIDIKSLDMSNVDTTVDKNAVEKEVDICDDVLLGKLVPLTVCKK